jgi:two-component system OmpR family response regulator
LYAGLQASDQLDRSQHPKEGADMTALNALYVDDDPDIREIAVLSLSLDGAITVRTADGGAAGQALLDVMMPDLDGPGTLLQIRERAHLTLTPVIFITARAMQTEQAQYMALGALGVIVKPFDPLALARQVRAMVLAAGFQA